jgi:pimeloyl-ACP methyl ester carboxylesterase
MIRFGYFDTTRGQVHFREAGAGPAVVLLHWTPGTSAQYSAVIEAFAAAGFRALALDLPGFGQSFRREGHWSIGDFAATVIECMVLSNAGKTTLVGGHLGSEIAIETVLRAPERIALAVLDGTPVWDETLRAAIVSGATPPALEIRAGGEHMAEIWTQVMGGVRIWRPNVAWTPELAAFAMKLLKARLLSDFDMRPSKALLEYDIFGALARLANAGVPVLALSAADDPLRSCHEALLARVPGASGHCFPGDHPVHRRAGAPEYVEPIIARWRALAEAAHGAHH